MKQQIEQRIKNAKLAGQTFMTIKQDITQDAIKMKNDLLRLETEELREHEYAEKTALVVWYFLRTLGVAG